MRATAAIDPGRVLDFWFDEAGPSRWFTADPAFDARVRRLFGPLVHRLDAELSVSGTVLDQPWITRADTALALVIALDQFPRNVFRGSNRAFALDPFAAETAYLAVEFGYDLDVPEPLRAFFYMPFMHSEHLEDQALGVALCRARLPADTSTLRHAEAHRDLIARFGRFPHRNAALGRNSTLEEEAFLAEGGYAPGARRRAN